MPSVDIQSRLHNNDGDLGHHNSTGSSSTDFDFVRNISQSRELHQQGKLHGKEITQDKEISQDKGKYQKIDFVRQISQNRELYQQDKFHEKEIKQDKEIIQDKGRLREFYTWTSNMVTEWARSMKTEQWPTLWRTGISEQGHERSQECKTSQQFSGRSVLHPLKALLVAGLLFSSGNIQGVEAGIFSRGKRVYKRNGWFGGSSYIGRGYVKRGWFGGSYVYSKSWFGRGKYIGRGSAKRGWFGRSYIKVRRRRWWQW